MWEEEDSGFMAWREMKFILGDHNSNKKLSKVGSEEEEEEVRKTIWSTESLRHWLTCWLLLSVDVCCLQKQSESLYCKAEYLLASNLSLAGAVVFQFASSSYVSLLSCLLSSTGLHTV